KPEFWPDDVGRLAGNGAAGMEQKSSRRFRKRYDMMCFVDDHARRGNFFKRLSMHGHVVAVGHPAQSRTQWRVGHRRSCNDAGQRWKFVSRPFQSLINSGVSVNDAK